MTTRQVASAVRASASRPPVVLVVDDDAEMRAYMRQCLAALPVRVIDAYDGEDALAQLSTKHQDDVTLVISDIHMPRMGGLALKASLAAHPRWGKVPVLLITGEAVRAQDRPVLCKPFNARKIKAVVQAMLNRQGPGI